MTGSKPGQALPVNQEAVEACWAGQGPVPCSLTHTWVYGTGLLQTPQVLAASVAQAGTQPQLSAAFCSFCS